MNTVPPARLTTVAVLAAPVLAGLYGGIRLLDGSRDPGPGWLVGHSLLMLALLLFAPLLVALERAPGPRRTPAARVAGRVALGAALTGLAASLGQIGIDLYVGAVAVDKADQHRLFEAVQSRPGVEPAFYSVLPLLFHLGLLALLVGASVGAGRVLRWWSPVLVAVGTVLTAADLAFLPLAAVCQLVALAPLAGFGPGARRPVAARAARAA
ncbi:MULTISPECIES: hypothetical protein [Kitasatospora]|uniref:hypothetical protein n=1 Tax=Kitasatospora TaxID=2063 RepID=UPI0006922EFA|nr:MULTISPECIES: hypothetical protein [Kitasatospora]